MKVVFYSNARANACQLTIFMPTPYILTIKQYEDGQFIHFHNMTNEFVEVMFTVNGRDVRKNQIPSSAIRGYGFAPKLDKSVRKRKDGTLVPLRKGDEIQAFVFSGVGSYKEEDMEKPTFLRHKLVDRFRFKRSSDEPVEVLEMKVV